jgi:hypothetical protein
MSSLDAAETWKRPISFLHIDGQHGKAHAYADLLVWDMMTMPHGIVVLDDRIGFMLGQISSGKQLHSQLRPA